MKSSPLRDLRLETAYKWMQGMLAAPSGDFMNFAELPYLKSGETVWLGFGMRCWEIQGSPHNFQHTSSRQGVLLVSWNGMDRALDIRGTD